MLEWKMFETARIQPKIVYENEKFSIKKFESGHEEFSFYKFNGELTEEMKIGVNEFSILMNLGGDIKVKYEFEESEEEFDFGQYTTALVVKGCRIIIGEGNYDFCACVENIEEGIKLID